MLLVLLLAVLLLVRPLLVLLVMLLRMVPVLLLVLLLMVPVLLMLLLLVLVLLLLVLLLLVLLLARCCRCSSGPLAGVGGPLGAILTSIDQRRRGLRFRTPLGTLEIAFWNPLGALSDGLEVLLGLCGRELGSSWAPLGPCWEPWRASWGQLGGHRSKEGGSLLC